MRALLSVSDRRGLVDFAQGLVELGWELVSTGGTQRVLAEAGLSVRTVEEITGFPAILDGRVKSLHPKIHGGVLARRDLASHRAELQTYGIEAIALVAVNLYPFVETVAKPGATQEQILEQIDIGGPALLRGAGKNFPHVLVVVDPDDYPEVLERLRQDSIDLSFRRALALKVFQHTAAYDTAITDYLRMGQEGFPQRLTLSLRKAQELRYGENPHQRAAFYLEEHVGWAQPTSLAGAQQLHGKELSYNNLLDADAAWRIVCDFAEPTVAVIKHTNPCGLATHEDLTEAYRRAFAGDPVSAYGGIVALNRPLDLATAQEMGKTFYEIILASDYHEEALALLRRKRDLRILRMPRNHREAAPAVAWEYRHIQGGFLVQTPDALAENEISLRTVTQREPTPEQVRDLRFAWQAVKHVKSNAIVVVKDRALLGMGAGQPNRVTSVELALKRAGDAAHGAVLASDAFFPFPDSIEQAAQGGILAIIQPGGSIRDQEVIAAADRLGLAMVFTGIRHFRH